MLFLRYLIASKDMFLDTFFKKHNEKMVKFRHDRNVTKLWDKKFSYMRSLSSYGIVFRTCLAFGIWCLAA